MPLDPLHEQAIDLFVAGMKQKQVAKELKVSPRTIRRWGENPEFVADLEKQHELARKLEQDEMEVIRREHLELQRLALRQLKAYLDDPNTPRALRVQCLRMSMQAVKFNLAQEWREHIYEERKEERQCREREAPISALDPELAALRAARLADKAAKCGQSLPITAVAPSMVQPVKPFRYPPTKK